jgi:FAD/FMN-containing dehydrogenase
VNVVEALRQALGEGAVLRDGATMLRHRTDKSGTGTILPRAVVRPRSTAEVSTALRICNERGATVVPQGGLTGLAGGANPQGGDIAMSLELLRCKELTAPPPLTVRCGTPAQEVQEAARAAGLYLALDLGARGSCQIGGNLATNAGGIRVIRYGMAREQVLGLEAVLADGTIVSSLNRMLKNNAGYDLKQLFIGSEGTLGIITRAVLRLHPPPGEIATACARCDHTLTWSR